MLSDMLFMGRNYASNIEDFLLIEMNEIKTWPHDLRGTSLACSEAQAIIACPIVTFCFAE